MSEPSNSSNALLRYSLAGEGNALKEAAQEQEPFLGNIALLGQTSVWYGPPNSGKTLIVLALLLKAVADKQVDPAKVFYLNADDSASGMAGKAVLLDDVGAHTLAPGHKGFELAMLAPAMASMTKDGTAKGSVIIIDTLKKVADLMSKKECAEFGQMARRFSMHGGTVLGLAHTNKNRSSNGKLVHAGTSNILEDFDCAYLLEGLEPKGSEPLKYVRFELKKRRGDNPDNACYRYSTEEKLSYEQRLMSVEEADPDYGPATETRTVDEPTVIDNIRMCITHGPNKKMQIVDVVRKATRASKRAILDVLDKHTGSDPDVDLWDFERRERGAHIFFLHETNEPPT